VRLYTDEDIELVRVAQHLTALGVALRDIAELATIRSRSKTGDQASHKVFALLEELRRSVEWKKKECELVLEQIDATARLVKRCFGCENPPTHLGCEKCPVARDVGKSRLLQLIWDKDKLRMAS
jgi:DNA-binding transcriptional MerR regulator